LAPTEGRVTNPQQINQKNCFIKKHLAAVVLNYIFSYTANAAIQQSKLTHKPRQKQQLPLPGMPMIDYILSYNIFGLISKASQNIANKSPKIAIFEHCTVVCHPLSSPGNPANIRTKLNTARN